MNVYLCLLGVSVAVLGTAVSAVLIVRHRRRARVANSGRPLRLVIDGRPDEPTRSAIVIEGGYHRGRRPALSLSYRREGSSGQR